MLRRFGAVLVLSCAACAPTAPVSSPHIDLGRSPAQPGSVDIVFEDHLAWPYRLTDLVVVLDGAVLYRKIEPIDAVTSIAHLERVPPGDHTVQLKAGVMYPTGAADEDCVLTLRAARTLTTNDTRPTTIRLDALLDDVTYGFAERVRFDIRTADMPPSPPGSAADSPGEPSVCD